MPDLISLRQLPGCGDKAPMYPHLRAVDWVNHCDACLTILAQAVEQETRENDAARAETIPEWVMKIVRCGDPSYDHIHTLICADLFNGVAQECEHEAANALSAFTSDVLLEISARYRTLAAQLRVNG